MAFGIIIPISHTFAQDVQNADKPEQVIEASNANVMDMPTSKTSDESQSISSEFPILRMTQDKSEVITLDQEAASVIVGNPNNISVLLDTPNSLVVVPKTAGASHFSVMGKDGTIIMQRHVIVGAQKEKYIRIRRSCNSNSGGRNNSGNCQELKTYFCPDSCHEVKEGIASRQR